MPGLPMGRAALDPGPAHCASRGMRVTLSGKTAHAPTPEHGISPMAAVASLMPALTALGPGGPLTERFALVTVTHARMGEPASGIAPRHAEVRATLRTLTDAGMAGLRAEAERLARDEAAAAGLGIETGYEDVFVHCENDPEGVAVLRRAMDAEGVPQDTGELPMRGSEDFGRFRHDPRAAMFFLGAGEDHPSLHNPDYDYPDELIGVGARMFVRALRELLG
jgi:metal-dependent amidase/aminoacylase/carboxypeptidase family protein